MDVRHQARNIKVSLKMESSYRWDRCHGREALDLEWVDWIIRIFGIVGMKTTDLHARFVVGLD